MYNKLILLYVVVLVSVSVDGQINVDRNIVDQQQGNFCQGCRSVVSYVSKFNSTANRDEYKDLFMKFCETYYPVSTDYRQGPCPIFVDTLFLLLDRIDPVLHCDQIGACDSTDHFMTTRDDFADNHKGIVCTVCEKVLLDVQLNIGDPKVVDTLHKLIDSFCDFLKVVDQDRECKQVLNNHIDDAIDFIRHMHPLKYCQSVELCPMNQTLKKSNQIPTLADFNDFGIETSVEIGLLKNANDLNTTNEIKSTCMFCKVFVKDMFRILKENRTEENITVALDKVCKLIYRKGPKFDNCEEIVSTYTKQLVQLLADETDPELICMILGLCTHQGPITMSEFISKLDSSIESGSTRACLECKFFIRYIQDTFTDPKTETNLKNWLLIKLCGSLQDEHMRDSCNELVNTYSDTFFKAISKELDPQETCIELSACTRGLKGTLLIDNIINLPVKEQIIVNEPTSHDGPYSHLKGRMCDQCTDIVAKIDEYLSAHSIEHDVSVLIDDVCNKISGKFIKDQCIYLVRNFGDYIANAVSTMDNPRQLCTHMGIC